MDARDLVHYVIAIMMKRILVRASLTVSLAASLGTLTVVGCGSGSSSNNNGDGGTVSGGDSGSGATGSGDGGTGVTGDGGTKASDGSTATGNPPLPDGSVLPTGTQLVPNSTALTLNGVTSDDYVIYTDTSSSTAYALSLASGSKPISLGTVASSGDVTVVGKVVFLGTSDSQGVGAASVWTSAASAPASLSASTYLGYFGVSADGSHVVFLDAIDANQATAAIAVAGADGSSKATLVPSVDLTNNVCFPQIGFGGASAVAAYCVVGDAGTVDAGEADGGTNVNIGTVSSFASPGWTAATIAQNVQTVFSVDSAGTKVVVNGAAGTVVYPIAGGAAVSIDATGEIGAATFSPGILTKDGSHILYTTGAQALERAATTAPASPVQLAGAGTFADILALSSDESWLIGTLNVNPNNGRGDLYLASAATAGTPVTLSTATTSALDGDPFTTDSSHALFFTGISKGVGTLAAMATGGGSPATLGSSVVTDFATSGAKVVFNDNYNSSTGGADLRGADTSGTAAATLLVTQADPTFYLNAEKTTIVYTWSYQAGTSSGLWSMPAP